MEYGSVSAQIRWLPAARRSGRFAGKSIRAQPHFQG
jgi:hypothetical protein